MIKKLFALLLGLSTIFGAKAQLLWRISGNGLKQPSYVMGSYHLAKVAFVDSVSHLRQVMDDCQQVVGEMDMTKVLSDTEAIRHMQECMMLPKGTTLKSLLSENEILRLNQFLTNTLGADLDNPMLAPLLQMKPAAVLNQLQVILCMKMEPGFSPNEQFDTYFQQMALQSQKSVVGLESLELQMNVLFNQTPLKRQVEQLMCLVDDPTYQMSLLQRTISAFYAQNLTTLEEVMNEKRHNTCDSTPEEEEALIYSRNSRWAQSLPALMRQHCTLVVVGAAHLPGKRGLLELLHEAGYEVAPYQ